jgi:hypothetical protein
MAAVYKNFERKADGTLDTVVAYIFSVVSWERYLVNLLPEGVNGMVVVLRNSCNQAFSYEINGPDVSALWLSLGTSAIRAQLSHLSSCSFCFSEKESCTTGRLRIEQEPQSHLTKTISTRTSPAKYLDIAGSF